MASLTACASDPNADVIVYPPSDVPVEWLRGEQIFSSEAPLTLAYSIDVEPSTGRLVMLDFYADRPVVVMAPDGTVLARRGGRGDGPGEFRDVRSLTIHGGAAYVWDLERHRLTRVPIRDIDDSLSSTSIEPIIHENLLRMILEVEPLRTGGLLLVGKMGSELAWISRDSVLSPLGRMAGGDSRWDERVRTGFSRASAAVSEKLGVLALGFVSTGHMIFLDIASRSIISDSKPGRWPPPRLERRPENGVLLPSPENFLGYRSVKGSSLGVWGLFLGNTTSLSHGPYSSRDVHVYDWNGRLHRILRLSVPVADIAVYGGYLYGASNKLVPQLLRWSLPTDLIAELEAVAIVNSPGSP